MQRRRQVRVHQAQRWKVLSPLGFLFALQFPDL